MGFIFDGELMAGILSGLAALVPSGLLGIATYVLSSMALYTIAGRRGLNNPWLAWVPVANSWLVGSVSDQYRYVVRRERRSKRKVLLVLSILSAVLTVAAVVQLIALAGHVISGAMWNYSEERIMRELMGYVANLAAVCLPLCAVSIAYAILRYMALNDIYKSLDPVNSTLYLVLSILIGATEPFFLFFNRNKDDGMPPRKKSPPIAADRPEPWTQEEPEKKDSL